MYTARIFRNPRQSWPGYGIYLGRGLVLTAAHVVGHAFLIPTVSIGGQDFEAKVVREGDFEKTDLTLLSIDETHLPEKIGLRVMPLCKRPPQPGQRVVVATPDAVSHSNIMSPKLLPADIRNCFDTVIVDVASTGNSGSGVFDDATRCLLGIMSRKI